MALLFVGLTASSQVMIKGKVADKKGVPVPGASVSVIDADGRIISGTSADIEGNFVLKNVNTKNKLIKLLGSVQDEFDREILIRDINDNHWVGEIPLECTDM